MSLLLPFAGEGHFCVTRATRRYIPHHLRRACSIRLKGDNEVRTQLALVMSQLDHSVSGLFSRVILVVKVLSGFCFQQSRKLRCWWRGPTRQTPFPYPYRKVIRKDYSESRAGSCRQNIKPRMHEWHRLIAGGLGVPHHSHGVCSLNVLTMSRALCLAFSDLLPNLPRA